MTRPCRKRVRHWPYPLDRRVRWDASLPESLPSFPCSPEPSAILSRPYRGCRPPVRSCSPPEFPARSFGTLPPRQRSRSQPQVSRTASLQSRRQGQGQAGRDGGDLRPALKDVRKVQFQRQRIIEFLGGDRQDPRQIRGCRQGSIGLADRGRVRVDRTAAIQAKGPLRELTGVDSNLKRFRPKACK